MAKYWNCKCGASYEGYQPKQCGCGRTDPLWPSEEPTGDYVVVRIAEW